MRFEEMLPLLRAGNPMRRAAWPGWCPVELPPEWDKVRAELSEYEKQSLKRWERAIVQDPAHWFSPRAILYLAQENIIVVDMRQQFNNPYKIQPGEDLDKWFKEKGAKWSDFEAGCLVFYDASSADILADDWEIRDMRRKPKQLRVRRAMSERQ